MHFTGWIPTDTTITILNNTFAPDTLSSMKVKIFEAKAYIDSYYAILMPTLDAFRDEGNQYNILKRENNKYVKYKIYESYVPPGVYNRLQLGIISDQLKIAGYKIPLELPDGESLLYDFDLEFVVNEYDTTEINIQIKPFESLERYKDTFLFNRKLNVISINIYH